MHERTVEALEGAEFDAAVWGSPEIDRFCSSADWILPACETWGADAEPYVARGAGGWAAFLRATDPAGRRVWLGFDAMWGFACPLVGPEPEALAEEVVRELRERSPEDWFGLLLQGLPVRSRILAALERRLERWCHVGPGPLLRRWVASLEGGLDGFLARRSAKFRGNLRRALRRCREAGVAIEAPDPAEEIDVLFERVRSVERRSWKGLQGTGLMSEDLFGFYRRMARRLRRRGGLRLLFARIRGEDAGYILGGVRGRTYRGFQFSYDQRYAHLSLGAVLQHAQIGRLAAEGVETYDLGIDLPYKHRWADRPFDTITLVAVRR